MYKYGDETRGIFVEQGTDRVPDDGLYYVIYEGKVVEGHASLKRALAQLNQLRTFGPSSEADEPARRAAQRDLAERFLRESSREKRARATRKGGKGGSGGVGR